eukprot:COSAG05_NODE_2674_length_2779_cov_2.144403_3_plen_43_part_00
MHICMVCAYYLYGRVIRKDATVMLADLYILCVRTGDPSVEPW